MPPLTLYRLRGRVRSIWLSAIKHSWCVMSRLLLNSWFSSFPPRTQRTVLEPFCFCSSEESNLCRRPLNPLPTSVVFLVFQVFGSLLSCLSRLNLPSGYYKFVLILDVLFIPNQNGFKLDCFCFHVFTFFCHESKFQRFPVCLTHLVSFNSSFLK